MYVLSHLESELEDLFFCLFIKSWFNCPLLTLTQLCHFGVHSDSPLEAGFTPHPQWSPTTEPHKAPPMRLEPTGFPGVGQSGLWVAGRSQVSAQDWVWPYVVWWYALDWGQQTCRAHPGFAADLTGGFRQFLLAPQSFCFLVSATSKIS